MLAPLKATVPLDGIPCRVAYNFGMSLPSATQTGPIVRLTEAELLRKLEANIDGTAVITSTVRAARGLRLRYNSQQHAAGKRGWQTPQILAWEPWLSTLWNAAVLSGIESRLLISEVQELELWRGVLARDEVARQTLSIDTLSESAHQAWQQMHRYQIPLSRLHHDSSTDTNAFYRWASEFERLSKKSLFLSPSLLEAAIAQWNPFPELHLPAVIYLLGFDRIAPSQTSLIEALQTRGSSLQFIELRPPETATAHPAIVYAPTLEEEITTAAQWIRQTLLENPSQRIGVIVPALEDIRGRIDSIFRRILIPSSMDVCLQSEALPYEFSLGSPMHGLHPVRTALALLRWLWEPLSAEEVSWLIVHGFFSRDQDGALDARAMLDRRFRERDFQLGGSVSLSTFRQWLSRPGRAEASLSPRQAQFRQTIEHFSLAGKRSNLEKSRSFSEWRELVEELLATAEWRLPTAIDSSAYQLLQRWNMLLNHLSSLSSVSGPVRFRDMLERLDHLAAHTLFALETTNAPVQVLGVTESAGLVFDAVWWLNVQTGAWPLQGKVLPFFPWNLQREAHMPYADPAADSIFALRTTSRILGSGNTTIASFALQPTDVANAGTHIPAPEILLSPQVREILYETQPIPVQDFLPAGFFSSPPSGPALECIQEEPAMQFAGDRVSGGVRFLELHAACPFRAFAELRFSSRPLEKPATGLSPNVQGSVLHQVLDQFWQETQSRTALLADTTEQRRQKLRRHIDQALREYSENAHEPWQTALLEIEADRLEARLLEWLEVEQSRADFTVVKTEDTLDHVRLGGIELRCRVDRIDEVDQGIVLLDYKTGPVQANACDGDRPDQPQLPAYAVLRQQTILPKQPLAGIAFAGLHPRKVAFTPISSLPGIFPLPADKRMDKRSTATSQDIQQQQESWNVILTRIAEEFQAGMAVVDPKNIHTTCTVCAQAPLCRVRETFLFVEQDRDDLDKIDSSSREGFGE